MTDGGIRAFSTRYGGGADKLGERLESGVSQGDGATQQQGQQQGHMMAAWVLEAGECREAPDY